MPKGSYAKVTLSTHKVEIKTTTGAIGNVEPPQSRTMIEILVRLNRKSIHYRFSEDEGSCIILTVNSRRNEGTRLIPDCLAPSWHVNRVDCACCRPMDW